MKAQSTNSRLLKTTTLTLIVTLAAAPAALAAIPWDGDGGDGNWFNPANWNRNSNDNNTLPPGGSATMPGTGDTDTEISAGTATLNGGLGVVYDPDSGLGPDNPYFPVPDSVNDPPAGFGYQSIRELYISRAGAGQAFVTPDNTVTIMGNLELSANMVVGRSSGSLTTATNGRVNQLGGLVKVHFNAMDMGQREGGGRIGYGNGIYDYRGGSLEASLQAGDFANHGIRLSAGGSAGTGGVGRFIMHNPATPGYVRALNFTLAAHAGVASMPDISPNGSTIGVGIAEFHYENGGTRPIQLTRNLIINNGTVATGTRSARLDLVLDAAPTVDGGGVPQNLGLFDVDFAFDSTLGDNSTFFDGAISGTGGLGLNLSSADGSTLYTQGSTVSATFGSAQYNWTISYTGKISWGTCDEVTQISMVCAAADSGTVGTIEATGGEDVVLIGLSSVIPPSGVLGDFNGDDVVDAADYVVWRKNIGNNPLPNDDGLTTQADRFNLWRANFGEMADNGSGSNAGAIPEPGALGLALVGAVGLAFRRRRGE